jgi:hypothetical protein
MTTNHHTAVPTNAPLTASMLEDRYSDLDAAITGLATGGDPIEALNLGAATTLTIASGSITRTQARHMVDTEGAATTDDLTTIAGGADGDRLILSAANTARSVVIKHGTGNIKTFSKSDITLDDADMTVEFQFDGAAWQQVNGLATKALPYPTTAPYRLPVGLPYRPHSGPRTRWGVRAAAATVQGEGVVTPTITATTTASASNDTDSTYVNLVSGAVSGNSSGFPMPTYNLARLSHNPIFRCVFRTGAAADIANIRLFVGFCSALMTTVDTIAGATEAAMFRYSTVAGDAGFTPVTKDATTQNLGSSMLAVAASTRYLFEIELDSINSRAIFTINNGTPQIVTANLPASSTELGVNFILFTTAAVAKNWKFSRLEVELD